MISNNGIHIYLKLKIIFRRSELYPFEFPGAFAPKPPAENDIPPKSLHMSYIVQVNFFKIDNFLGNPWSRFKITKINIIICNDQCKATVKLLKVFLCQFILAVLAPFNAETK